MFAQFRAWHCAAQQGLKSIIRSATAAELAGNRSFTMSQQTMSQQNPDPKVLSTGSTVPPMKEGLMRLYSMRFCPFAHRARLVLACKKVPHETININLKKKPEWFLEKNPNGEVPVVEKDGVIVYDSMVVAEYLDSVYKDPTLVASDPLRKSQDSMLINFNGAKVVPNYYKIINAKGDDPEAIQTLMTGLKKLNDTLADRGSKFFGGDRPGFLDFMIWPWQERLPVLKQFPQVDVSLAEFPSLKEWHKSMKEDPDVKTCAQTDEMHAKFIALWKGDDPNPYDVGLQ